MKLKFWGTRLGGGGGRAVERPYHAPGRSHPCPHTGKSRPKPPRLHTSNRHTMHCASGTVPQTQGL